MDEIWKDIDGYEGLYKISSTGKVLSLGNVQTKKSKVLKNRISKGYYNVVLYKNKKHRLHLIHRLIAKAFIPNPGNKP